MRVLFLTQVLPYPLDAGPKVRAYYVLRHLAQSHEVTLVSFVRPTDTDEAVAHLSEFCTAIHTVPMLRSTKQDLQHLARSLVSQQPFLIVRDWVPEMSQKLTAVVDSDGPFDVVHSDQLWMAQYALGLSIPAGNGRRPLMLLDQHNAVYMIPERLAEGESNPVKSRLLQLEARKMAQYEVDVCGKFDQVVWVTQEDYDAVRAQADSANGQETPCSAVIPICTDPETEPAVHRVTDSRRITFLGGLHYPPNAQGVLWFAEKVFPSIVDQAPDAVLTVIGKQPPTDLKQLGIDERNLDVTGYVADVKPYLEQTAAFIVPLHAGGGMRVKILDAWTWGVPIVSTTVGAEGIDTRPGVDILIADDPQEFANSAVRLIQDPALSEQIVHAGRQTVMERYNWRTRYVAWDALYGPRRAVSR